MSFPIDRKTICNTQDSLFSNGTKALIITTPLLLLSFRIISMSIEQSKDQTKALHKKIIDLSLGISLGVIISIPFVISIAIIVFAKSSRFMDCYPRPKISY